jgi:hypothetical protein
MYGIFMITLAGYCALALKGPRATFWIALLYGCGAGFTFDELGMWLNSSISPRLRWDRDGLAIGVFALVIAGLFSIGIKKKSALPEIEPTTFSGSSEQQSNTSDVSTSDAMAVSLED